MVKGTSIVLAHVSADVALHVDQAELMQGIEQEGGDGIFEVEEIIRDHKDRSFEAAIDKIVEDL